MYILNYSFFISTDISSRETDLQNRPQVPLQTLIPLAAGSGFRRSVFQGKEPRVVPVHFSLDEARVEEAPLKTSEKLSGRSPKPKPAGNDQKENLSFQSETCPLSTERIRTQRLLSSHQWERLCSSPAKKIYKEPQHTNPVLRVYIA